MGRKKQNSSEQVRRRTKEEISGIVSAANASVAVSQVFDAAKVESEFSDILNYQRKTANNLLGVFVGEKYQLSQELIARLVAIPKKFDRIENNILYAATILGEFVLNFKIEMDIQPDYCTAKLSLIETEQDVEDFIKHVSLLEEVTEVYMFEFRNYLCEKWNIFYDDQEIDKGDAIYKYLHMQSEEFLFNRELVEILSQLYVVRMLALLDGMSELGQKSQYEFKLLMEKYLANDPSIAQNFTIQKRFLDFVLKKNNAFAEVLKTEEGMKVLQGFSKPLVNIRDKTYPTVLENKKEEKKTEKAASKPAAKAKAKKKGGADKGPSGGAVDPWKGYKAIKHGSASFGALKKAAPQAVNAAELPKPFERGQEKPSEKTRGLSSAASKLEEQTPSIQYSPIAGNIYDKTSVPPPPLTVEGGDELKKDSGLLNEGLDATNINKNPRPSTGTLSSQAEKEFERE